MKITQKQLVMLWDILKSTLNIESSMVGLSQKRRERLVNEIISQQSNEVVEVKSSKKE